jgi:hypothetical protein
LVPDGVQRLQLDLTVDQKVYLPGLTVSKFKLTSENDNDIDIKQVTILSYPTNINLSLGQLPPFWTRLGEMTDEETTPDFAEFLQIFLNEAKVENGVYIVPVVVHSDIIARVDIIFDIEYVRQSEVLPAGLSEVVLPFDYGGEPKQEKGLLEVSLPVGAKVIPKDTTVKVIGAFEESRIAYGPYGIQTSEKKKMVSVKPSFSQAQPIQLENETPVTSFDMLLAAVSSTVNLEVNLMDDSDGKPFGESLLPTPVTIQLDRDTADSPTWISAPLSREFLLRKDKRYWLVLQVIEGEAAWGVDGADPAKSDATPLHFTDNGGLSWRETTVKETEDTLVALFRLRNTPTRFQVPIELQVGSGKLARRVKLDRFQPLGRVDFTLDFDEVANAINDYLNEASQTSCLEAEHIINGDFESWTRLNDEDNPRHSIPYPWTVTSGRVVSKALPNPLNLAAQLGYSLPTDGGPVQTVPTAISQVVPIVGGCEYQFEFLGSSTNGEGLAEIFWMGDECVEIQSEQIPITESEQIPTIGIEGGGSISSFHRVKLKSPANATQAEVRFTVPAETVAVIDQVSLMITSETVINGRLWTQPNKLPVDWKIFEDGTEKELEEVKGIQLIQQDKGIEVKNSDSGTVSLVQTVQALADKTYVLEFHGRTISEPTLQTNPRVELHWLKDDGSEIGLPSTIEVMPAGSNHYLQEGKVPLDVDHGEIHLMVPPVSSLEVEKVSLKNPVEIEVPLTFIAQSPGEMTVSDLRVAYEITPAERPPIPAKGLCSPTPPGRKPGEGPKDCCFCSCCGTETTMKEQVSIETKDGGPAVVGRCSQCGSDMVSPGGLSVQGAKQVSLEAAIASRRKARSGTRAIRRKKSKKGIAHRVSAELPVSRTSNKKVFVTEEKIPETVEKKEESPFRSKEQEQLANLASEILTLMQDPVLSPLRSYKLDTILELSPEKLYERLRKD